MLLPICRVPCPDDGEIKCAREAGHEGSHGAAAFNKGLGFVRWDD